MCIRRRMPGGQAGPRVDPAKRRFDGGGDRRRRAGDGPIIGLLALLPSARSGAATEYNGRVRPPPRRPGGADHPPRRPDLPGCLALPLAPTPRIRAGGRRDRSSPPPPAHSRRDLAQPPGAAGASPARRRARADPAAAPQRGWRAWSGDAASTARPPAWWTQRESGPATAAPPPARPEGLTAARPRAATIDIHHSTARIRAFTIDAALRPWRSVAVITINVRFAPSPIAP